MIADPSGVHAGATYHVRSPRVTARGFRPSASAIQRFSAPVRSLTNTMRFPSGEKRGCESHVGPLVMRVAVPPPIGSVYRSPRRSKMTVRPSGETSTDIQVPSLVVKRSERGVGGTGERAVESCAPMGVGEGQSAAPATSTAASGRAAAFMAIGNLSPRSGGECRRSQGFATRSSQPFAGGADLMTAFGASADSRGRECNPAAPRFVQEHLVTYPGDYECRF